MSYAECGLKSFPMKTTTFYLVLCLVTVALISSCGKDYPDPASACCTCLKEKTTTGRGTMSMKIDNHIWSNCNVKNENYRSVGVYWDPMYNKFDIEGSQYYSNEAAEKFYINVRRPFLGDYIESNKYKFLFNLYYQGTYNGWAEYVMDTTKPFKLNVHFLDEEKRIISGTFECWMVKQWGEKFLQDSIHITEGQFDTRY